MLRLTSQRVNCRSGIVTGYKGPSIVLPAKIPIPPLAFYLELRVSQFTYPLESQKRRWGYAGGYLCHSGHGSFLCTGLKMSIWVHDNSLSPFPVFQRRLDGSEPKRLGQADQCRR